MVLQNSAFFDNESFGPAKAKRYSAVLVGRGVKCYLFAGILILFHLKSEDKVGPI